MKQLKEKILEAASEAGEGHVPSSFSILDMLLVLYERIARIDPKNPDDPARDRIFLSKGHASLGLYAVLAQRGFFSIETLRSMGEFESILGGHPDRTKIPGVEASTGSLGHGFPMAVGSALGMKIKKTDTQVYAIIGDGECNEGTIWEAAMLAAHHKLANLTCIVDYNHSGDRALLLGDITKKFASFGWDAVEVNGHDQDALYGAIVAPRHGQPRAIIAQTIKGYGLKSMENNPEWHHKSPKPGEELEKMRAEIA